MGQRMGIWSACQTWLSADRGGGGGGAVPVISAGPGGGVVLGLTRKNWDFTVVFQGSQCKVHLVLFQRLQEPPSLCVLALGPVAL